MDGFEYTPSEEELEEIEDIVIDVSKIELVKLKESKASGEKDITERMSIEEYLEKKLLV